MKLRSLLPTPRNPDDPASLDPAFIEWVAPWLDRFCRAWFRLEVRGLEHLPEGPALLVGNHNSGVTFVEALGTGARVYVERGTGEYMHGLGHDAVVDAPLIGDLLVRAGAVRASHEAGGGSSG